MHRRSTLVWLVGFVGLLTLSADARSARADIASGHVHATRQGEEIRLDVSSGGHYETFPSCVVDIERSTDGQPAVQIHSGDLGSTGSECTCILDWMATDPPTADATGQPCEQTSYQGTCPDSFACNCTLQCAPLFDQPCNGLQRYYAVWHGAYSPTSATTSIDVTWIEECALGQAGCNCATSRLAPQLFVVFLLLLGALIPGWLARRRGRGGPRRHRRHRG